MKQIFLCLSLCLAAIDLFAQRDLSYSSCSKIRPSFCVGEPVYTRGYYGKVIAFSSSNQYVFTSNGGTNLNGVEANEMYRLSSGSIGNSNPKFKVDDLAFVDGYYGSIVGAGVNGRYVFKSQGGTTIADVTPSSIYRMNSEVCGRTRPIFCVDEPTHTRGYQGKIMGVTFEGKYVFRSNGGTTISDLSVGELTKIIDNGRRSTGGGLMCDNLDVYISDDAKEVFGAYAALATVSTSDRAEYLNEISKYITAYQANPYVIIFSRLVFAQITKSSTAKVVKDVFTKPVQDDLRELEKVGWKSIDQVKPESMTLDFATRVLAAAVKLRMGMPDANPSIQAFRSRLAASAAEERLSAKIVTLQQIVTDMQPLLMELVQDPRHSSLGMVSQSVAGWILKN
jgi:hypothetical protein